MSAFGTQKVPTTNLNVGFPSAFSQRYADKGFGEADAPVPPPADHFNFEPGSDFQAEWHKQKKADADHMANQKVKSTIMANVRAYTAPHNMPDQPKAVLGQRKFANGSMGSIYSHSTRLDQPSEGAPFVQIPNSSEVSPYESKGLSGGVLRSLTGQTYGYTKLQDRIQQLNDIQSAKQEFQEQGNNPTNASTATFAGEQAEQSLSLVPQVELAQLLQSVNDSLQPSQDEEGYSKTLEGSRFTFQDSSRAFALIVRLASTGTNHDIMNVLDYVEGDSNGDGILPKLVEMNRADGQGENFPPAVKSLLLTLQNFWSNISKYLKEMLKLTGEPAQARATASKALIQSLGFLKMVKSGELPRPEAQPIQVQQQAVDNRAPQFPGGGPGGGGGEDGDGDEGLDDNGDGFVVTASGRRVPVRRGRLITREDSRHGYSGMGGAQFDADERNAFASNSGRDLETNGGRGREEPWAGLVGEGEEEELAMNRAGFDDAPPGGYVMGSFNDPATGQPNIRIGRPAMSQRFGRPSALAMSEEEAYGAPEGFPQTAEERREQMDRADALLQARAEAQRAGPRVQQQRQSVAEDRYRQGYSDIATFGITAKDLPKTVAGYTKLARALRAQFPDGVGESAWIPKDPRTTNINSLRQLYVRKLGLQTRSVKATSE